MSKEDTEMAMTLAKVIAAATATAIGVYFVIQLVHIVSAALARFKDQVSEEEAETRRSFARLVGNMHGGITRVQQQLPVPNVPIPRRRPAG
jgi:hypothetical protein